MVLVMLLSHWRQVLHSRLDNRFDLLALLVTGINAAQYPIRRELEARPHHVWIIGPLPPRAAGTVSGPEPPARALLGLCIQVNTPDQQTPQEATRHHTCEEATTGAGLGRLLHACRPCIIKRTHIVLLIVVTSLPNCLHPSSIRALYCWSSSSM